jgi:hypothetical protein
MEFGVVRELIKFARVDPDHTPIRLKVLDTDPPLAVGHRRRQPDPSEPGQMATGRTEPISFSAGLPPEAWLIAACDKYPEVPMDQRVTGRTRC